MYWSLLLESWTSLTLGKCYCWKLESKGKTRYDTFRSRKSSKILAKSYLDLTGYDYTASFSTKGKLRPLKHLWKNETSQETFSCLGDVEEIDESMLNVCEEFVCLLYNGKKVKLVNELCFDMFLTKYKTTDEQHLNEVKKMDASSLPPCQRVLTVKIARTRYICRIWRYFQYFQVHQQHLHQRHQDGTLKITNTRSSGLTEI